MAMDLRDPNVWISHLLENLPEEKLASALKDDNPNWEYIDGEIVKLGSLAHSQLDIPELQRRGLVILASESKDFRLLAHLLRTLQHAGDPHLALRLLALYVEHYWAVAAPQNMAHKKRFASQVIKRFETGIEVFSQNAATAQRDALSGELAKLAQCWQSHNAPELPQLTGLLFNDHTPFISEQTKQWLAASPDAKVAPVAQIGEESKAARACFAEQGLEAALRYLDMLPEGDPRDQFHRQYLAAQLTEEAGLVQLAQQQYRMLFRMGLQMMVADWEPSLLEQLEQKFTAEQ
ncbi:type VI secretion system domain-containing protein [Escherichia coli]|nr:type VI secretion system domain-containing protein [Escherichia coli]EIQ9905113.1 type VI secretion system domain-containing protein [Escherichia coli]ELD1728938.1 type VI secretion system domain-containing protein [Escherichia coli]ELD1737698.1 type VI secretion system domain-containing protein [Escherichia coli]ELO3191585.1 type VI secretion system domain-containing protein [Escherichia coli]